MGLYGRAIEDYSRAIKMDPKLGQGIDWFTRIIQNRKEHDQTLSERVKVLRDKINVKKEVLH